MTKPKLVLSYCYSGNASVGKRTKSDIVAGVKAGLVRFLEKYGYPPIGISVRPEEYDKGLRDLDIQEILLKKYVTPFHFHVYPVVLKRLPKVYTERSSV